MQLFPVSFHQHQCHLFWGGDLDIDGSPRFFKFRPQKYNHNSNIGKKEGEEEEKGRERGGREGEGKLGRGEGGEGEGE